MATITELYEFNLDGIYYTYVPKITSVVFGGKTFQPAIISRSDINITDNVLKNSLNIKLPRTNEFARLLLKNIPENPVLFTLYRNGSIYWRGQVINASGSGIFIELDCTSTYSKTTRPSLGARIQLSCRHVLYGEACAAVKDSFAVSATINTVSTNGTIITVLSLSQPDNYFLNGEILFNGQRRNILKHTGLTLRLASPFNLTPTGSITLYPGCDHTETTCNSKFTNVVNFGGFSRLPLKNPHSSSGLL